MLPLEQVLLFFLPAMAANLMLFLTGHFYGTSVVVPLDLRGRVGGQRIIGEGRGLTSLPRALAAGMLCGAFQGRLEEAVVLALGAQLGMVANSLLKRRMNQRNLSRPYNLQKMFFQSLKTWIWIHCPRRSLRN